MGNFNKFDKGRGGKGFGGGQFSGGGRRFGGRNDGPKQKHPATCSQCGQNCEVPFKPTGDRPVFCSDCFKSQGSSSPRFAPKSFSGGNRGGNIGGNSGGVVSKAQFDSLNVKLDKILVLLTVAKAAETVKADVLEVKSKKEVAKKVKTPVKKSKVKKK